MDWTRKARPVLAMGLIGVSVSIIGCTTKSTPAATPTPTTRTSTKPPNQPAATVATYVDAINKLCSTTESNATKIKLDGYSATTPVSLYLKQMPRLRRIYRSFDSHFAKLTIPAGGANVAEAMRVYITASDTQKRRMLAAATKGQTAYKTEYNPPDRLLG